MAELSQAFHVVGGVDTHKDLHVAAVVDHKDRVLGTKSFATTQHGYRLMLSWMRSFGGLQRIGIECSGSYGAGLLRYMQAAGIKVLEVTAPAIRPAPMPSITSSASTIRHVVTRPSKPYAIRGESDESSSCRQRNRQQLIAVNPLQSSGIARLQARLLWVRMGIGKEKPRRCGRGSSGSGGDGG